jgi:hypothetical protein
MTELIGQLSAALAPTLKKHKSQNTPIYLIGPMLKEAPRHLNNSDTVIYVDGGARYNLGFGFSAGDGDSFQEPNKLDFLFPKDKDLSDLGLILAALKNSSQIFELLGFSGGRLDHELFNMGEIHRFLSASVKPTKVKLDQNLLFFSRGQWQLNIDGTFSVGTLTENLVSLTGHCKFQINPSAKLLPLESFGLSNVGSGLVQLTSTEPIFIYQEFIT